MERIKDSILKFLYNSSKTTRLKRSPRRAGLKANAECCSHRQGVEEYNGSTIIKVAPPHGNENLLLVQVLRKDQNNISLNSFPFKFSPVTNQKANMEVPHNPALFLISTSEGAKHITESRKSHNAYTISFAAASQEVFLGVNQTHSSLNTEAWTQSVRNALISEDHPVFRKTVIMYISLLLHKQLKRSRSIK